MGKGRKVQREWGKRSSLDQKKQRAFSNDGSRESGFEFSSKEKRRTESAVNPNGQFLAKSWLSRYASLLLIAAGLVGLISFLMMYMRPTFKSEGNQSAVSSVNTVPTESENKIEILTEGNSAFIEKNREVDFQFEEILELIKTMNQPNMSPEDIVEKYGKASSGSVDNRVEDSQLVLLSYKLTGRKGVVNMHLRSTGGGMELSTVSADFLQNAEASITKTVDDYRSLIPKSDREGMEVKQAIEELGMPKSIYAHKPVKGKVDSLLLEYSTTDNMTVSLFFYEVNGLYRLKSMMTSTV
ncbi:MULTISPECIES: hypothetical protein [Streptococcus]|jgi:hypothetical protein|uniref:hypothetical protein n=1 Tax=Streptococcus TaxID=1301 RepID=UPI00065FAC4F|nr:MULTISPECIES: hypothetical protein [Streptococcus]MDL2431809.1 hypothetical protein [Streptococcus sp. SC1]RSJ73977.1 hypothetical protein D8799_02045 [Streptococcus cristatus]